MIRKKFLAFTIAFSMACSGTVSVGASAINTESVVEQQAELLAEPGADDGTVQDGTPDGPAVSSDGESDNNNEQVPAVPEPGLSENISGNISGNDSLPEEPAPEPGDETVSDNENGIVGYTWDTSYAPRYYKLKKPGTDGQYYTAEDGIVTIVLASGNQASYLFDQEGKMRTGLCTASGNTPETYYFLTREETISDCNSELEEPDGQPIIEPSPINSRIGQMLKQQGWLHVGEQWLYLKDNGAWDTSMVGMQTLSDNKVYYLSENAVPEKDVLRTVSDNTYYFGEDGVMITDQAKEIDGNLYYFGADGAMAVNEFQKVGDKQYYFDEEGKQLKKTGWQKLSGSWYYFDKDYSRVIKTKWQKITENGNANYYYFDADGKMAKNEFVKADKYLYRVDSAGCRVTGLKKIDGSYYYFRPKKEGSAPVGSAYKGWVKIGAYWYRFTSEFKAQTSQLIAIGSKYYSFTKTGKMYKGGLKKINGKYYYFEKQTSKARKGYAVTKKWVKKGGKWYYATAKAYMKTNGWVKDKGNYYYFGADSTMVKNKWVQRNGKWGYLKGNGVFSQNWVKIKGNWKYAKKDGTFAKGWTTVKQNGSKYKFYFNKKGVLVQDVRNRVSGPYILKVDRKRNQITVYTKDSSGKYNTPVVAFPCSVGLPATPTPVGTFIGTRAGRWQQLMGPSYGQYATLVDAANGIFIHSVAGSAPNINSLPYGEWNKLGRSAASHGCIRVAVADAKWIYQNCNGATVEVRDYANAGPFDQKTYRKINSSYKWDPTDPEGRGYL